MEYTKDSHLMQPMPSTLISEIRPITFSKTGTWVENLTFSLLLCHLMTEWQLGKNPCNSSQVLSSFKFCITAIKKKKKAVYITSCSYPKRIAEKLGCSFSHLFLDFSCILGTDYRTEQRNQMSLQSQFASLNQNSYWTHPKWCLIMD